MVIKQNVAYGIVRSVEELWKDNEFQDFTVIVDGTEVKCHSFLLAACSDFFRALLRSEMKETSEKTVTLANISEETFWFIMQAIYTGSDVLTLDNVFDIWHATNQLQIQFLVRECETFCEDNISLDNYEKVYKNAKMLDSASVLATVQRFMEKHFDDFWKTETFLELEFDTFVSMVESQDLVVPSEDIVIEAILKWVKHDDIHVVDNDDGEESKSQKNKGHQTFEDQNLGNSESICSKIRGEDDTTTSSGASSMASKVDTESQDKQKKMRGNRMCHIVELMNSARTCLVSPDSLEMLMKNTVMMENHEIKQIVFEAILYQLEVDRRNGILLKAAFHRGSSDFANGVVYVRGERTVEIFLPSDEKQYKLTALPNKLAAGRGNVAVFDNRLCALTTISLSSCYPLFVYENNAWKKICDLSLQNNRTLISCGNFMFNFDKNGQDVSKLNLRSEDIKVQPCNSCPDDITICSVTHFKKRLLVFSNQTNNGTDETCVHCFDPRHETWTRLNNIEGPAEQITGVYDGTDKYILQTTGKLWRVTEDEEGLIDFVFCCQIWDGQYQIWGAFLYKDQFFIAGNRRFKENCTRRSVDVAGQEKYLRVWSRSGPFSPFFPVIIPRTWLSPLND